MNKRIKKLAEQANLNEIIDDAYLERHDWQPFVEKFAELIVRECVKECQQEWYNLNNANTTDLDARAIAINVGQKNGVLKCINKIKQHFGVD